MCDENKESNYPLKIFGGRREFEKLPTKSRLTEANENGLHTLNKSTNSLLIVNNFNNNDSSATHK